MQYYYIYKMSDPDTDEFYIGRRTSSKIPLEDFKYRGSSKTWYKTLDDNTINNKLIKVILEEANSQIELNELEIKWISENIKNPLCRNAYIPNKGFHNIKPASKETREKLSKIAKNRSEETKAKSSESKKGIPLSEEHKKKVSESLKGRKFTDEHKLKLSESGKKRKFTEEHKQNLSKRIINDEWKKKLSEAAKNRIGYVWINNGIERTRVKIEDLEKFLDLGWKRGKNFK